MAHLFSTFWMTKYIIGEFFSSGGATLYKNSSDQTVISKEEHNIRYKFLHFL